MELQEVLDSEGLEQQHHVGEVGALDLWHRGDQHLVLVGRLCVQPVALPAGSGGRGGGGEGRGGEGRGGEGRGGNTLTICDRTENTGFCITIIIVKKIPLLLRSKGQIRGCNYCHDR